MKCIHIWIVVTLLGLVSHGAIAQLCPENFDAVAAPALPAAWTSTVDGAGVAWVTVADPHDTPPNTAFAPNAAAIGSAYLVSPATYINSTNSRITFRHFYATESTFDGGVLEISVNGGAYSDILAAGGSFVVGGYNATISASFGSPIGGRQAWSGSSGGYITTTVQLPASTLGQLVRVRWRMASDSSVGATGWRVDSIVCGVATAGSSPWRFAEQPYPIRIMDQATTVMGGVLYSFGGWSTSGTVATSYKYDGAQWTQIGSLPVARRYAAAVNDGDHIFILGGLDSSDTTSATMYRYTPQTNTYETMVPFTTAVRGPGVVLLDGKILKVGGTTNASAAATFVAEIYDISSNTWAPRAPYPIALGFISLFTRNGYVYGAGGFDAAGIATNKTYRYDSALDVWDDAPIPDLPDARAGGAVINLPGGALLVGGYVGGGLVQANTSASTIAWDAIVNSWRSFPPLISARARMGAGLLLGQPVVVGGTGIQTMQQDVQLYDRLFADGFEPLN